MGIEWNLTTGWPSQVIGNLKRSITQFANNNAYVKVGITNNSDRRWGEHLKVDSGWERMIVLYKTSSVKHARYLEKELVEYFWNRDENYNFTGGGGGQLGNFTNYYLYVLLQKSEE